nr:CLIP domain-containing serine protease 14D-like [Bactrocera oleae]
MAFKKYFGFLLSLCCVHCFNKIVANAGNDCQTKSGQSGKCIPILNCSSLVELSVKVSRTEMETALLKYSFCKLEEFTYKVYCPQKDYISAALNNDKIQSRGNLPTTKECGLDAPSIANRIYGGVNTINGEYPWTVGIFFKNKLTFPDNEDFLICAGSLITEYFVITAAHCFSDEKKSVPDYFVRLGARIINNPMLDNEIDAIIKHPHYRKKTSVNDAALLHMKVGVKYSQITPICLPLDVSLRDNKRYEKQQASISGWGMTKKDNSDPSSIQLKTHVEIIPVVQKEKYYYCNNFTISSSKMCATGKDHDACKADSGGPLMIKETLNGSTNWYLIGISFLE